MDRTTERHTKSQKTQKKRKKTDLRTDGLTDGSKINHREGGYYINININSTEALLNPLRLSSCQHRQRKLILDLDSEKMDFKNSIQQKAETFFLERYCKISAWTLMQLAQS